MVLLAVLLGAGQVPAQVRAEEPVVVALMGNRLFGPAGEELGRLVDVLTDADGRPVAVVVDVGGFMGIGARRVALAWTALRFVREPGAVRLAIDIDPDRVIAAPEYRHGEAATIFNPAAGK